VDKVLIWFGLAVFFSIVALASGLIDHGDIGPAILTLLSLPCLGLGIYYHIHPKGSPILLMLAISFIAAGAEWALWRRYMWIAIIPVSCVYFCIMAGLIELERVIPRLPKPIRDLLQW